MNNSFTIFEIVHISRLKPLYERISGSLAPPTQQQGNNAQQQAPVGNNELEEVEE